MSPGIAAVFASRGHAVTTWSRSLERCEAANGRAKQLSEFLALRDLAPLAATAAARLHATSALADIADADVVIEAIAENLDAKRDLLARVEDVCRSDALIATNTSGLRVTDIARDLGRPERFVAMHFWNPAHLIPLVEVAGGDRGSRESVAYAVELARSIGKLPVVLEREVLGFLGTRMQQAVVREAIALLEAGVASAADIDLAVRASFGIRFPVLGPLETTDLSGLDVIGSIQGYLLADLDASSAPQRALQERVDRGDLGVKSGRGFHDWSERDADELIRQRDEELVRRLRLLEDQGALRPGGAVAQ
jgi:3-hydroxybutyryl-CoA dehydrogenase